MSKSAGNVVAPQDVIKQSGAEILRLWVSAQDYREDLRISQEILNHLIEAYRKIRNTCRFLLSNLYDFDPAQHRVPFEQLPELDRWALMRLGDLVPRVRKGYDEFEFHTIFHALNNFCSVDLSAVYLDILKDRLYTTAADSLPRRAAQSALWHILQSFTRLMAPILSFTAEEIWSLLSRNEDDSVMVHVFHALPAVEGEARLVEDWSRIRAVRAEAMKVIEDRRSEGKVGSSLQAEVEVHAAGETHDLLAALGDDLRFVLISSCLLYTSPSPRDRTRSRMPSSA